MVNLKIKEETTPTRSEEVSILLSALQELIVPFIAAADEDAKSKHTGHGLQIQGGGPRTTLVEYHKPQKLQSLMNFTLPDAGVGKDGLLKCIEQILQYSVNTWDPGFLSKLYASTDAVGLASELLLATLNTNVYVYQVSPALTVIEKTTTKALASLFGLSGPRAGGISVQGGSASNTTSIVIGRNTLYPETKEQGNAAGGLKLCVFVSAHGHYSISKAAQMLGLGSSAVKSVPVDSNGRMVPSALSTAIRDAKAAGLTPFHVTATAGTTVLGSYDPFTEIAAIAKEHNMWFHIDASWGGPAIFSPKHAYKMAGSHLADSIAINPHKMMGVPLTCSFLLGRDIKTFHASNTLPASYLFHGDQGEESTPENSELWDLADLTLQCGRRGDSLKLALGWIYHGREGYASQIETAFDTAAYFAQKVQDHPDLQLVSENPPPCMQVCFYWKPKGEFVGQTREERSRVTARIADGLVREGFMIDYAPGNREEEGSMFRVVVSRYTGRGVVDGLVAAVEKLGREYIP